MSASTNTIVIMRADCSGDPGGVDFPPFKYGYCYEGMAGACCAPARGFSLVMTWPQWRYVREHTSASWQDWLAKWAVWS